MTWSRVVTSLVLSCLSFLPALASQPADRAVNLITDLGDSDFSLPGACGPRGIEWYEFVGLQPLEPTDSLRLDLAFVPFDTGDTYVGLDKIDGQTFFGLVFTDGLVQGIPYRRHDWNDVTVVLRPASQDYLLTVNGQQAGPFAFAEFCAGQGGCYSVQALRIHGFSNDAGSSAWFDSITMTKESGGGADELLSLTFDGCFSGPVRPAVSGGVAAVLLPPRKFVPVANGH